MLEPLRIEAKSGSRRLLQVGVFACALAAFSYALYDVLLLHPAYANTDESFALIYVQLAREGLKLPFNIFSGSWLRLAQYCSVFLFGAKLWAMHLPVFLAFGLENFLLWRLARQRLGEEAALGALFFNVVNAFSLLRLRSLISYSVFPCEFLFCLNLLPPAARQGQALLSGFLGGLFCLEYEAWASGCLILALLPLLGFTERKRCLALFAGLGLGLGISALASHQELLSYFLIRSHYSAPDANSPFASLFVNLKAFFWPGGSETIPYLAPDLHAVIGSFSLPFVLLGLYRLRGKAWLWAWLLIGLAPLLAYSLGAEPNRGIAAWPLLVLLMGEGLQGFLEWGKNLRPSRIRAGLLLFFLAAFSAESFAFGSNMLEHYEDSYGRSVTRLQEGAYLVEQSQERPLRLLSHLQIIEEAELRFDADGFHEVTNGALLAAIEDGEMPAFDAKSGSWLLIHPYVDVAPERLLAPSTSWAQRLSEDDQSLKNFEAGLDMIDLRSDAQKIYAWLDAHPQADPWVRGALWEEAMHYASLSADVDEKRIQELLKEPLLDASPLYEPGVIMIRSRPRDALALLLRAKALDPRRDLGASSYQDIENYARSMEFKKL